MCNPQILLLAQRCILLLKAKQSEFAAPISIFRGFFQICRALPLSEIRIAALIILAPQKGNERTGETRKPIRWTRLLFQKAPTNEAILTRNENIVIIGKLPNKSTKGCPATVQGPYPSIKTTFHPP
jgi:hypothetical protein